MWLWLGRERVARSFSSPCSKPWPRGSSSAGGVLAKNQRAPPDRPFVGSHSLVQVDRADLMLASMYSNIILVVNLGLGTAALVHNKRPAFCPALPVAGP